MYSIPEQKDIAPTLAEVLRVPYDVPSGKSLEVGKRFIGKKVLLAIIDSLDWQVYLRMGKSIIKEIFEGSMQELKISSPADVTSPAIATILTGLDPEEHKVFSTADARSSEILNLPEVAQLNGVKSTVIMESGGASTFTRYLEVSDIEDRDDIDEFDNETLSALKDSYCKFDFIICHLRTLDEYLHQGRESGEVNEGLKRILQRTIEMTKDKDYLLVITGDHKAHGDLFEGSEILPLLFLDFSNPKC